jgi:molybdopterin synthase catalytic subunit
VNVSVQLFAVARQLANRSTVDVVLPTGATIAELRQALVAAVPALAGMAGQLRFAIDEEYAPDHARIAEGSRVACIPPVSGG